MIYPNSLFILKVSRIIQKLERELNVSLFIRKTSGMEPTKAGDNLYDRGKAIMRQLNEVVSDLQVSSKPVVKVPCTCGFMRSATIKLARDFHIEYPDIELRLYERVDTVISRQLLDEEVEVAILSGPVDPTKFTSTPLTKCPMCVVVNKTHPFARFDSISLFELRNEPLIITSGNDFNSYQNRFRVLTQVGINLNYVFESLDIEYPIIAANDNMGVGITPYDSCLTKQNYPDIKILHLKDTDHSWIYSWETVLACKKGRQLSLQAKAFSNFLSDWIKQI